MIRLIKPLSGIITQVIIDEEGFMSVYVAHPACGAHTSYAFGSLELEDGDLKCDSCEDTLLEWVVEDDDVPDATGLGPEKDYSL